MPLADIARPVGFDAPPSDADDSKRIKGIGSVIEKTLNELGIYQFKQIAAWNDENVSWVESSLAFPGRITRENWIEQAKTLSEGGTTEFAKRVDKGSVDYNS
jgi:predicted flap endonuclease-1-like 5' DNA nuclease